MSVVIVPPSSKSNFAFLFITPTFVFNNIEMKTMSFAHGFAAVHAAGFEAVKKVRKRERLVIEMLPMLKMH